MAFLNKDAILRANDIKTEDIEVPEWGGTLRLKMLTGQERDAFEASMVQTRKGKQEQNLANFRARLIALCAIEVNEDGTNGPRMFQSAGDIIYLGNKSAAALQRVFNKCNEMNGLSEKDVDEMTEGFGDDQSEPSTIG